MTPYGVSPDVELEGVEDLVGAQPHVRAAAARRRWGRRRSAYLAADGGVDAVAGDHQVVRRAQLVDVRRLGPEAHAARRARGSAPAGSAAGVGGSSRRSRGRRRWSAACPRKWTSMSSQRANSRCHPRVDAGSACSMPPSVSSREHHAEAERVVGGVALPDGDLVPGPSCLASAAKYRPAGPPPMTAMRMAPRPPARRAALAQPEPLQLAGRGARQRGHELDRRAGTCTARSACLTKSCSSATLAGVAGRRPSRSTTYARARSCPRSGSGAADHAALDHVRVRRAAPPRPRGRRCCSPAEMIMSSLRAWYQK